jgi:DNA-binding LytR/AlgR family response regulator
VNLEQITKLQMSFHGDYKVFTESGKILTLSRGYREKVSRLLGWSV